MREILFKAKRKDNGEWVEGGYFSEPYTEKKFIICWNSFGLGFNEFIEVEPDTICQYTGLTDKNGKKIWENDIVEIAGEDGYFKCEWEKDTSRFVLNGDGLTVDFDNYYGYECEVIGNIFDNADLLEVE